MSVLIDTAARFPDRPALIGGGRQGETHSMSWTALRDEALRFAGALKAVGVRRGDIVASVLDNTREHGILLHAIWLCGAACAPLNRRLSEMEQFAQIAHLRPALVVHDTDFPERAHVLEGPPLRSIVTLRDDAASIIPETVRTLPPEGGDICSVLFTSGTSGHPKAVPHSWDNHRASAQASMRNLGEYERDKWQCVIPLCHVGGLSIILRSLFSGMAVRLHARFDAQEVRDALRNDGVTITSLVPTMLRRLLRTSPTISHDGLPALRAILLGGAAADETLWHEALERGLPVLGTYGMTESCAQVCTASPALVAEDAGTAGRPLTGVELRICDADGNDLPQGTEGEIRLRGPMVTSGYLRADEEMAALFDDGWFRTGDIGWMDAEGRLHVAARREDLIVSGGEKIVPAEIESVLLGHDAVADAGVVGIDDREWGQRVTAVLVLRRPCDAEELSEMCRERLGGFKIPRTWYVVDALPRTASGKLRRTELREMLHGATPVYST